MHASYTCPGKLQPTNLIFMPYIPPPAEVQHNRSYMHASYTSPAEVQHNRSLHACLIYLESFLQDSNRESKHRRGTMTRSLTFNYSNFSALLLSLVIEAGAIPNIRPLPIPNISRHVIPRTWLLPINGITSCQPLTGCGNVKARTILDVASDSTASSPRGAVSPPLSTPHTT